MRVNRFLLPGLIILTLLGTVLTAQLAGMWTTSGRATANLEQLQPADIKGWMTLQQVSTGLGISEDELYTRAGIPADVPPSTALKDLEDIISVTTLRERLAAQAE